jgi:hypothetical protein
MTEVVLEVEGIGLYPKHIAVLKIVQEAASSIPPPLDQNMMTLDFALASCAPSILAQCPKTLLATTLQDVVCTGDGTKSPCWTVQGRLQAEPTKQWRVVYYTS